MWDTHRGRALPTKVKVQMEDVAGLDDLGSSLLEAHWRFDTRITYNRWFKVWLSFCRVSMCSAMPAEEVWLTRFLTYLTLGYAAATVQICACAVAAAHRLNGFDNPLTPTLKSMLKAISAVGMCGTRSKKFIVDGSFIVAMCSAFLEEYPVFDAERFDPTVSVQSDEGRSIMWLRAVAMILLGLEIGARAGEITRMTVCCWQARDDGSVYVLVHLAKNGKNGELSGAVLVRGEGDFKDNYSAISFFEEFYFPFLRSQGLGLSKKCILSKFRTAVCPACSPMFPVWPHSKSKGESGVKPIAVSQVTSSVKKWAARIGRDASNYSAISFRRGSVSLAAAAKVDRNIRKRHCRWKGETTQDIYTEVSAPEEKVYGLALRKTILKSRAARGKNVKFFDFQT